jgi:hypothetical protein
MPIFLGKMRVFLGALLSKMNFHANFLNTSQVMQEVQEAIQGSGTAMQSARAQGIVIFLSTAHTKEKLLCRKVIPDSRVNFTKL